jgi:hypothetical protein
MRIDLDLGDMTAAGNVKFTGSKKAVSSRPGSRISSGKPSGGK